MAIKYIYGTIFYDSVRQVKDDLQGIPKPTVGQLQDLENVREALSKILELDAILKKVKVKIPNIDF